MLHDSCLQESDDAIIWHMAGSATSVLEKVSPNKKDKCPVHCETLYVV